MTQPAIPHPNVTTRHDALIIGGGPAGAATAALLAQSGARVALFEREQMPRHHVGESLIPAVNDVLAKVGVLDRMDDFAFPQKFGVQFLSPTVPGKPFYFSEV